MTGDEHFAQAESELDAADELEHSGDVQGAALGLLRGLVHAQLATAAASRSSYGQQ